MDTAARLQLVQELELAERQLRTPLEHKLAGKVALVTGAGRGLGRAYALRLARLGADVVINDVRMDSATEYGEQLTAPSVVDECKAYGVRSIGIQADVTKKAEVTGMVEQAIAEFGRVDILVNNAGGALTPWDRGFAEMMPEEDYRFILDVNLSSTIFCCQAVLPGMTERGWGRIVNVASQAALEAQTGGWNAHYAVAKAGICHYTRLLALRVGPAGIHVNAIAPGLILASRPIFNNGRADPENLEPAAAAIPLRRLGTPEDCARVVEFLVTDLSDYVTGQIVSVCGGIVRHPF